MAHGARQNLRKRCRNRNPRDELKWTCLALVDGNKPELAHTYAFEPKLHILSSSCSVRTGSETKKKSRVISNFVRNEGRKYLQIRHN